MLAAAHRSEIGFDGIFGGTTSAASGSKSKSKSENESKSESEI